MILGSTETVAARTGRCMDHDGSHVNVNALVHSKIVDASSTDTSEELSRHMHL